MSKLKARKKMKYKSMKFRKLIKEATKRMSAYRRDKIYI